MTDSTDEVIRSADNRTLKLIRSLRQRKTREAERAFVVEGVRAVEDALDAGGTPRLLLVRADSELDMRRTDAPVRYVIPALFNQLAETEHPQPLLGVFAIPELDIQEDGAPLFLVADGVQDPGNLGTLMRTSAAAGVSAVFITPGTVDPYNGKVVRSAMGAHFRVPVRELDDRWQERVAHTCPLRVVAEAGAAETYDALAWGGAAALIVGSEAHGPGDIGRRLGNVTARIPLQNGVESLNVGVAASIMLFEAARQRRSPEQR
jgi:TrmH family RNA methyltransferase